MQIYFSFIVNLKNKQTSYIDPVVRFPNRTGSLKKDVKPNNFLRVLESNDLKIRVIRRIRVIRDSDNLTIE